ncbi:unsaturated chondroitin disaccharide hydrolase [Paenibacillus phyllosphaerae]|uniref:Unsaturated chondroitin disaccharide hydrolase n=1 Tax=Paenibacillus phyllosphaerae TaxID=274593 RepID=A0A7W5B2U3_9BACL|nr:glycoside hydrolase family 88 protein [Paenibacillus phyllosphaerae]MBB3113303.1 unsaturated chondroitin disaccharide hydrolase [Paenibacillus phyllosphaerae]
MNWTDAIEQTLLTTRANIARFGDQFPYVSNGERNYQLTGHSSWTEGFWPGILWLSYEYSRDPAFREAALSSTASLSERLAKRTYIDHHDIGFLYSLSTKAQWIITKDEASRRTALDAADWLLTRWRPNTQLIQAWGAEGDPVNGGRIIIDCLMNLPLLYWAAEQTGDKRYADIARVQAEKSRRFLVRGDDSSYHTFYFHPETGEALRGGTQQGYQDGSTWTRGQAWGVYGFALAFRYFRDEAYLDTARRLARNFIAHLPEDQVAYWDFDAPQESGTPRDSSASAITACGLLELVELMPDCLDRVLFRHAAERSMASLVQSYFTAGHSEEEGFLRHGSYSVRGGVSPDDFVIWGDYFFLEALMRLRGGITGYWYER